MEMIRNNGIVFILIFIINVEWKEILTKDHTFFVLSEVTHLLYYCVKIIVVQSLLQLFVLHTALCVLVILYHDDDSPTS